MCVYVRVLVRASNYNFNVNTMLDLRWVRPFRLPIGKTTTHHEQEIKHIKMSDCSPCQDSPPCRFVRYTSDLWVPGFITCPESQVSDKRG